METYKVVYFGVIMLGVILLYLPARKIIAELKEMWKESKNVRIK